MTNLTATEFNYYEAGGQDIPSKKKKLREKKIQKLDLRLLKNIFFLKIYLLILDVDRERCLKYQKIILTAV